MPDTAIVDFASPDGKSHAEMTAAFGARADTKRRQDDAWRAGMRQRPGSEPVIVDKRPDAISAAV